MNVRVNVGGANDRVERNVMQYHCMCGRANWSKKLPRRSEVKSREETPKKAGRSIIPDTAHSRPGLWHIGGFFMKKAGRWPGLPIVRAADLPGRPIGMSLAPLRRSTSDGCKISPVTASRQLESQTWQYGSSRHGRGRLSSNFLALGRRLLVAFFGGPIHGLRPPP